MKVGIITMFYDSCNYGGILQAYALTKALGNMGVDSEQICYKLDSAYPVIRRIKMLGKKILNELMQVRFFSIILKLHKRNCIVRKAAERFVPHSKGVYSERTIDSCVNKYDAFVSGSDQVWSQNWPAFFLSFVPEGKIKIGYAVSIGNSTLPQNEIDYIRKYAESFAAISVREEDSAEKLNRIIEGKTVEMTLDPTLLLNREDWEAVTSPRLVSEDYLFCYFLGADSRLRKLALDYAKERNLKVVTIPHMQQRVEINDLGFGDKQVFYALPQDFLSYVKYANAVFTDSFHACVFSQVFQKQYYVFRRSEFANMGNRIVTLTRLFGTESHFVDEEKGYSIESINSIQDIDYSGLDESFIKRRQDSLRFLECNLNLKELKTGTYGK